jgi:hypothetical protein
VTRHCPTEQSGIRYTPHLLLCILEATTSLAVTGKEHPFVKPPLVTFVVTLGRQ